MLAIGETRDGRSDMTNFEMDLLDTRMFSEPEPSRRACKNSFIRPSCFPISVIVLFVVLVVLFPSMQDGLSSESYSEKQPCCEPCEFHLVESIPENLTYPSGAPLHQSTYAVWRRLITSAKKRLDVAAFYWTLRGKDVQPIPDHSAWQGEEIFRLLKEAGRRQVLIRIAQNLGDKSQSTDSAELYKEGLAKVRNLNFTKWFGSGVLHTKLWIADQKHFYLGSANMDWRSLTQVKEMGVAVFNCSCLVEDLQKVFDVYWHMGETPDIPKPWPPIYVSRYNASNPLPVAFNGSINDVFFSSSPYEFCPENRQSDISAILDVIRKAKRFIHIAVMDYSPTTLYTTQKRFWPVIDDALRKAAFERGIHVKLLASKWNHTSSSMLKFLDSLVALNGALHHGSIEVKLFQVPAFTPQQAQIPFARVNHNKYMVTDNTAYIGTSNWSGDYFIDTGGTAIIVTCNSQNGTDCATPSPVLQLQNVFERDWNSTYSKPLALLHDLI